MSAIEGLEIVAPQLDTDSSPLNYRSHIIIHDSKHGTAMVGKLFAPIMLTGFDSGRAGVT